ncbi:unnamed protein product [Dovyalis caffra]|uniref:TIR domain-containing protein n=1 Tax=Dovyalis caffra TaxID=77055 RepID=A0AAV1RRI7_9ROSI|nr:unnamed protein product [Dovyalis caffra]
MSDSLVVSSTPAALRLHWDVFLSFCRADTRHQSFTEHLYDSLNKQDIRVFSDDSAGMIQGGEIAPPIMEAIEDSASSIIILSPSYANSHWRLEELARICQLRRQILPVFYQVDPSHVRRQNGPFEQDFVNHLERFGEDKVAKWREAMNKVGGISGLVFDTREEYQLILRLVNRVLTELRHTPVGIATYTVGLDSRIENLKKSFIDDKSNRIQVLGLYGMGGIEEAIDILKGCGFKAETAITALTVKCLVKIVKISADYELWMHDQLRDMGRQIVQHEDLLNPGRRSRLWDRGEIMTILKHKKKFPPINPEEETVFSIIEAAIVAECTLYGTKHIQGIILDFEKKKYMKTQGVSWVRALNPCPILAYLIEKYMLLRQESEDGKLILDTEALKSMVNLRLLQINHAEVQGNFKNFPSGLKWLQWKNCPLKNLPSDYAPHELAVLDLSESGIERVWGWTSNKVAENLMVMNLRRCYNLVACPDLSGLLPESIFRLTKLEKLSLNGCQFIKRLPKLLGNLISLKELSLNQSAVEELPDSFGSLSNLEKLSLMWCESLTAIPESVGNLQLLAEVSINSSAIKELPDAIGSLPYLKKLFAGGCHSLNRLPNTIGGLASMSELELDGSPISDLPEQIGGLKMIEKLYMRKCKSLRSLPEAIGSILNLTAINLFGCNIIELPESIGRLENLVWLRLGQCKKLHKLPVSIGELKSLCHLLMEKTAVTVLPESFGKLSSLMILTMGKEPLESLSTQEQLVVLPASFSELSLLQELDARAWRISGKIPDDFEKLSSLEFLHLGYNNFSSLPSSLCGLSLLKKLYLPHCEQLESLPSLPSSLEEVDVSNCFALETISDVSKLGSLTSLNITNCDKVGDIPGIEFSKSLKWLYMSNCKACSLTVKRRLSKVCLRNIRNLSMPGSKIPDWFSQEDVVYYSERRNREIKAVIICVVVSLERQIREDLRYSPVVPDIQANVLDQNRHIFSTALYLQGMPKTHEDQIHLCRYSRFSHLVLMLKDGFKIQVRKRNPPVIERVELKKCGIHLVYEDDDDYGGNEESLDESQQSVSLKLEKFFNSYERREPSLLKLEHKYFEDLSCMGTGNEWWSYIQFGGC